MMAVHAVVTYDVGFTQLMPPGSSPTNLFSVASKVHTHYPTSIDSTGYTFPADLDTDVHQFHLLSASDLVADGLRETAEISSAIDDPSSARGFKDWFLINGTNSVLWQFYTRKINDPIYRGGDGAQLTFDLTADVANTLVVKLVADQWNETSQTAYFASVPISIGLNQISLSLSDFLLADNVTPLSSWSRARFIGFGSGQAFGLNSDGWSGSIPILANLEWSGGVTTLDDGVTTTWLASFGLPLSNDAIVQDTDGDGQRNGAENKAGTSPVDPSSVLRIDSTEVSNGNQLRVEWPTVLGRTYALWYSPDLSPASWSLLEGGIPYSGPVGSRDILLNGEKGFFRIELE